MKTTPDCVGCLVRQAMSTLARTMPEGPERFLAIRNILLESTALDYDLPPPVLTGRLQAVLRGITKVDDPYLGEKRRYTQLALKLLPKLEEEVAAAPNPFIAAVRLAIAGNVIDFGAKSSLTEGEVLAAVHAATNAPLHGEPDELEQLAAKARSILYLADNAGESVLDTLLLSRLPKGLVTIAVRGRPILNDVTESDARDASMDQFGTLVSNGSDVPGTHLQSCDPAFVRLFRRTDLIISKGQGNYETLLGEKAPIFFLFRVKCPLVADMTGQPLNGNLAMKSPNFTPLCRTAPDREDA
jgi:uncharacterized protein with ATP-grasp and redox domains